MIYIEEQQSTQHPSGKDVFFFTMRNQSGTELTITNYGAIIMSIKVKQSDGNYNDIVLGFDKPENYWDETYLKNYPYFGAAIGRYGNRINHAAITIDGITYKLNGQQPNFQLHGGLEGFDKKVWDVVSAENGKVILQYTSKDSEEGFPGNLITKITFTLTDDDQITYEYEAETDQPTAVNLTHHSYFNLNNGKGTALNHHVKIHAAHYLEQDANLCCTGNLIDVTGTRNDFTDYNETGNIENYQSGIDISFPLDKVGIEHIAAEMYCDESDVKLELYTTAPLVHIYNSSGLSELSGKNETKYNRFSAICLETQVHPNAINISNFPNTVLRPGEKYYTKTIYKLVKK